MHWVKLGLIAISSAFGLYLMAGMSASTDMQLFADQFFTPLGMLVITGYAWITGIVIKL